MSSLIQAATRKLEDFRLRKAEGEPVVIEREQIVAHATLSGWVDHWPTQAEAETKNLLADTQEIKVAEHSRWAVQRRIAIAKLAREFTAQK